MRISDEKEEERFKALDETLRAHSEGKQRKGRGSGDPNAVFSKKRFGRSGKKL